MVPPFSLGSQTLYLNLILSFYPLTFCVLQLVVPIRVSRYVCPSQILSVLSIGSLRRVFIVSNSSEDSNLRVLLNLNFTRNSQFTHLNPISIF